MKSKYCGPQKMTMGISREKILEECRTEAPILPTLPPSASATCSKCGGSGWTHKGTCPQCRKPPCPRCKGVGTISIGFEDEVCPICNGDPGYITLQEVLEDARKTVESWEDARNTQVLERSYNPNQCPDCGGS